MGAVFPRLDELVPTKEATTMAVLEGTFSEIPHLNKRQFGVAYSAVRLGILQFSNFDILRFSLELTGRLSVKSYQFWEGAEASNACMFAGG